MKENVFADLGALEYYISKIEGKESDDAKKRLDNISKVLFQEIKIF